MPWVPIEQAGSKQTPDYREVFTESGPMRDYLLSGALQLDKYKRGAQNLYAKATGNEQMQADIAAAQTADQPLLDVLQTRSPVASTLGTMAPALSTMGIPGGLLTQAGIGAATSGLEYGENQSAQAVMGGLLSGAGVLGAKGVNQIIGKGRNVIKSASMKGSPLKGEALRLSKRAEELNMVLSPGDLQGNRQLKGLEAGFKSNPATGGIPGQRIDNNNEVVVQLALREIGESGDSITQALAPAADRIGAVYDRVGKEYGKDVFRMNIERLNDMTPTTDTLKYFKEYLRKFPTLVDGKLTGKEFNALRQMVQGDIRNAWKSLPASADDLQEFGAMLVDSIADQVPGYGDDLAKAGKQWKILKALESGKTITKDAINTQSFATALARMDKGGFTRLRNKSDLYDAIRIGNQFSDIVGDSGTATRTWIGLLASDKQAAVNALYMRPLVRKYYESGGSPLISGLFGVIPESQPIEQFSAGLLRGYGATP